MRQKYGKCVWSCPNKSYSYGTKRGKISEHILGKPKNALEKLTN